LFKKDYEQQDRLMLRYTNRKSRMVPHTYVDVGSRVGADPKMLTMHDSIFQDEVVAMHSLLSRSALDFLATKT
jgi:hypothetical protein